MSCCYCGASWENISQEIVSVTALCQETSSLCLSNNWSKGGYYVVEVPPGLLVRTLLFHLTTILTSIHRCIRFLGCVVHLIKL